MLRIAVLGTLFAGLPAAAAAAPASQSVYFAAVADDHSLGLAGAPNFRDLGGYRTRDGHVVRRGIVFRSSKLAPLTPADWSRVEQLHVRQVYDLRTVEERRAEPDAWPAPAPPVYASPKPNMDAALANMRQAGSDPARVRAAIRGFYATMPTVYASEYAAFFRGLAGDGGAVVVHCTAGKDRTGVASALLLTALGVPRATVVADYHMTERLLPQAPMQTSAQSGAAPAAPIGGRGAVTLLAMPAAARQAMWAADPSYIEAALDAVNRRYGSIDAYLRGALGLTPIEIASLRRRLLE